MGLAQSFIPALTHIQSKAAQITKPNKDATSFSSNVSEQVRDSESTKHKTKMTIPQLAIPIPTSVHSHCTQNTKLKKYYRSGHMPVST